jgi:hypothetical protein
VALPEEFIAETTYPTFYCQYKNWFPEINKHLDPIDLYHRAQLRLEPKSNITDIIPELEVSHLRQLDIEVEPKANVIMPGTLPWSRQIDKRFLAWCPNPFLWLNFYNSNQQEIRFCKIPTKIDDRIILPEKASYYFATAEERYLMLYGDIYSDCLLSTEEIIIWDKFDEIEIDLYHHKVNWTSPTHITMIWKLLKKWNMEVSITDTAYSISKKYLEAEKLEEASKRSKEIFDYEITWPSSMEAVKLAPPSYALKTFDDELEDYVPEESYNIEPIQEEIQYYDSDESSDHAIEYDFVEAKVIGENEEYDAEYRHESDLDQPEPSDSGDSDSEE